MNNEDDEDEEDDDEDIPGMDGFQCREYCNQFLLCE